ncbi:Na+/H+-exchanging protein [Richelia intracellularis]|nr:Na+/H+-exchanging protein [Richelia intracellularis]
MGLPPVLGELVAGVFVGISCLHLIVFPEGGADASSSLIIDVLESTAGLSSDGANGIFASQLEVISVLAELGVIILLF